MTPPFPTTPGRIGLAALLVAALAPAALAQPAAGPAPRIRLFRIQPGFLSEPVGLEEERAAPAEPEGGPDFVSVAFGNDNPFFDFRQRGDPGGVGYARVNTQVQLIGTDKTAFSLGLQAVAPAGLEYDGLPDRMGATVLSPALSLFHALNGGTAVQAFVAKNVPIQNGGAAATVSRDFQYGMAVQRPVSTDGDDLWRHLYLSVGALGQVRTESAARAAFEVLPGLHYRAGENWWISGAVSMPVGPARPDAQSWQVTCSWQF